MPGPSNPNEGIPSVTGQDLGNPTSTPGAATATPATGLLIDGMCVPLCASAATDPDPMTGQSDGWGYENNASCLVAGGAPALRGTAACDLVAPEMPVVPALPPVPDGPVTRPDGTESAGFFVSGGRLYDRRGNDFVMRGINNPLAWFQSRTNGAIPWLDQIASTGANAVRLVWETDVTDTTLLRDAIQRSLDLHLVPMVEMHDVTGSTVAADPARMAHYLTDTDAVKQILLDYEDSLLINIANEWSGANNVYVQSYTDAINVFRSAGIRHTLVIDANGYGQTANTVLTQGQALLTADPQHNLVFSVHMYEEFRNAQTIRDTLQKASDQQLPFIVGEFGFQHGTDQQGNPIQIPYDVLLSESERLGLGYLPWSWTGNGSPDQPLDLTARSGSADALSDWGKGVIDGDNGIRSTAKPASIFAE